jgi:DNA-binding NtrC family response regulator
MLAEGSAMSPRVLVVEDEYQIAADLAASLRKLGCDVQLANGPDSAMELIRKRSPDVAFIDINLRGGFEGLDLARDIEEQTDAGIVFVTGYSAADLYTRMARHSRSLTIFKPVNARTLQVALDMSTPGRRNGIRPTTEH